MGCIGFTLCAILRMYGAHDCMYDLSLFNQDMLQDTKDVDQT